MALFFGLVFSIAPLPPKIVLLTPLFVLPVEMIGNTMALMKQNQKFKINY